MRVACPPVLRRGPGERWDGPFRSGRVERSVLPREWGLAGAAALAVLVWTPCVRAAPPAWVDAPGADLVGGRAGLSPVPPSAQGEPAEGAPGPAESAGAHRGEGPALEEEGWGGSGQWLGDGRGGLGLPEPVERPFAQPFLLSAHTGVHLFSGALGRVTRAGNQLGVELHLRPLEVAELEVGYVVSRTPLNPDLHPSGALWRNHLGALVKAGPLLLSRQLRPFVGVGGGVSHVFAGEGAPLAFRSAFAWELPVAVGLEWRLGRVTTGVRGSFRALLGSRLLAEPRPGEFQGGLLGASLMVGGPF